jgi:5-methylcytosine-specific restriction endonuclease McrA
MDKADVLEYYEQRVRSVQLEYYLPAVLRVRRHRSAPRRAATVTLNRANIMLRDRYQCQYCGSSRDLTIDHVVAQVGRTPGWAWRPPAAAARCCY